MDDKEIKQIIKDEIKENKLQFVERNLRTILIVGGLFLTIFGVVYPIFISITSSNRVDELSQRMEGKVDKLIERIENRVGNLESDVEQNVKELKGDVRYLSNEQRAQLNDAESKLGEKITDFERKFDIITKDAYRKPVLVCLFDNKPIGDEIRIDELKLDVEFKLINDGDGIASNIKAFAFIQENKGLSTNYYIIDKSMEYIEGYTTTKLSDNYFTLDPKQSTYLNLYLSIDRKIKTASTNVILRFLYGQPEPTEYRFKIVYEEKKPLQD